MYRSLITTQAPFFKNVTTFPTKFFDYLQSQTVHFVQFLGNVIYFENDHNYSAMSTRTSQKNTELKKYKTPYNSQST